MPDTRVSGTASGVIFDLDGTLLDSLGDLAAAMNSILSEVGCTPHPNDAYRSFVGYGVDHLVQTALPEELRADEQLLTRCRALMRERYAGAMTVHTHPYNGIVEVLEELGGRAVPLAVLTNKIDGQTQRLVKHYFTSIPFVAVIGAEAGWPSKPDPASAVFIADRMGLDPADVLFVGDGDTDMQTAVRAAMYPLGCSWGFRTPKQLLDAGAAAIIDHPRQVTEFVAGGR